MIRLLGPNSHRDDFAIALDKEVAQKRILDFGDKSLSDAHIRELYGLLDNRDWSLAVARKQTISGTHPVQCLYRPFDFRYMLYGTFAFDYPRLEINNNLLMENLALISTRQTKENFSVLVCNKPAGQHKLATPYDGSYLSPLYLYPAEKKSHLFDDAEGEPAGRRPNLAPDFVKDFGERLGLTFVPDGYGDRQATFGPEDVFNYLYAVLYSPAYRSRYAEFLKSDFPRLSLTSQPDLFRALCALGGELVGLHLMEKKGPATVNYPIALPKLDSAKDTVEAVRYAEPTGGDQGRVYINKAQYFDGVRPEVWAFQVGGYQVCQKWLKDRKGRTLAFDDIRHYQGVVAALGETIRLMGAIDETIDDHGGWPLV